ncbi:MAG TPA: hypothetical protein VLT61_15210 [Anaeromyxobacteraceae bacterium]|nr:hypothetical protein [Anaeromyxobacteraceae bacterium]
MTTKLATLVVAGALILVPFRALTDDDEEYYGEPSNAAVESVTPSTPAPSQPPPAPPAVQPPAPSAPAASAPTLPPGQWVYTWQYGWVWMPYGDAYSWIPGNGWGDPLMYVYYPVYGWCWIDAPWVWGIGPWPYFGFYGAVNFGWYSHGWWREPWRWHYAPARAGSGIVRPIRGRPLGGAVVRPAPFRSTRDFGVHATAPAWRSSTPRFEGGGFPRGGGEVRGGGFRGGFGRGGGRR